MVKPGRAFVYGLIDASKLIAHLDHYVQPSTTMALAVRAVGHVQWQMVSAPVTGPNTNCPKRIGPHCGGNSAMGTTIERQADPVLL